MKNIIYTLWVLFACIACGNDEVDYLFEKEGTPEQRKEYVLNEYTQILTAPEHGWIGYYSSLDFVGGWGLIFEFGTDYMVNIKSEYVDALKWSFDNTVSYRVDISQQPELTFESYCMLHYWFLAPGMNGQLIGDGEFEFTFEKITAEEVILVSKTDKNYITRLVLHPAKPGDDDFSKADEMEKKVAYDVDKGYFRGIEVSELNFRAGIDMDADMRMLALIHKTEDGEMVVQDRRIAIVEDGILMLDSLLLPSGHKLGRFSFEEKEQCFISSDNGVTAKIRYSDLPYVPRFEFVDEWGGGSRKYQENLGYDLYIFNMINSVSQEFKDLINPVADDNLSSFYIMRNNKYDTRCRYENAFMFMFADIDSHGEYVKRYLSLPIKIEIIPGEKVIFYLEKSLQEVVEQEFSDNPIELSRLQRLVDLLADPSGFYMMKTEVDWVIGDGILVSMFFSVKDPSIRFVMSFMPNEG